MLLHEIFSLFKSIDSLILEGFKDDMYRLYPDAKDDAAFNNAIKIYNSNENKIRDAVKKKITINGSVAKAFKDKFPDSTAFVSFIDDLAKEVGQKAKESAEKQKSQSHQLKLKIGDEYRQIRAGKLDVSSTDYWLIPCHTFEEAHAAASKYTGNLPRLSKEEITKKYGIVTPKPATLYKTDKTPAEFLEYMKNEDRFFMPPTWCIAADNFYFDRRYKLATKPDEKAKCYIVISKKYPNVRFCITLEDAEIMLEDDSFCKKAKIQELRDPWQIGDRSKTGIEMMKLAFGENNVEKILQKAQTFSHEKKLSDIIDGESLFRANSNITKISTPLSSLKNGKSMFQYCGFLKKFQSDLSSLVNGEFMFSGCYKLKNFFNINLSSLKNGESMFSNCEELWTFDVKKMPSLENGHIMFMGTNLLTFGTDIPKLNDGRSMFSGCKNLYSFIANTPVLKDGYRMFEGCTKLSIFRR